MNNNAIEMRDKRKRNEISNIINKRARERKSIQFLDNWKDECYKTGSMSENEMRKYKETRQAKPHQSVRNEEWSLPVQNYMDAVFPPTHQPRSMSSTL